MRFSLSVAALAVLPFAASLVINDELLSFCKSPTITQQSFLGDVIMTTVQCSNFLPSSHYKRQDVNSSNVCGAQCDTHCFNPAGDGPDPNDCSVISGALRYDSQDISEEFNVTAANTIFVLQYHSCQSFFVNQADNTDLTYCRSDWASVIDWVAWNCQATQNAHGGLCVAAKQDWFIQIQKFVNATATATSTETSSTSTGTETATVIPETITSLSSSTATGTETSTGTSETSTGTETSSSSSGTSTSTSATTATATTTA